MRTPGVKTLRKAARWLRSRYSPGALILGYHRVAHVHSDPHGLCVSPQHFEEQLAVLRREARPIALGELLRGLQEGHVPARAIAVTFDDGYADVLAQAQPLLERYEIPATVFVVSGCLGGSFWWDGAPQTAATNGAADSVALQDDDGRALTLQELACLASKPSIDVGAHSVGHPALAALTVTEQRYEVEESKATLEDLIAQPVRGFSYPHGSASDVTRDIVRRSGYAYACSSFNDVARVASDPFYLPRFWPGDWDGDRFGRWLKWWLRP